MILQESSIIVSETQLGKQIHVSTEKPLLSGFKLHFGLENGIHQGSSIENKYHPLQNQK